MFVLVGVWTTHYVLGAYWCYQNNQLTFIISSWKWSCKQQNIILNICACSNVISWFTFQLDHRSLCTILSFSKWPLRRTIVTMWKGFSLWLLKTMILFGVQISWFAIFSWWSFNILISSITIYLMCFYRINIAMSI